MNNTCQQSIIDVNMILDCLYLVYNELKDDDRYAKIVNELKKIDVTRTCYANFEVIKSVAKGGYGEVFLVKWNDEMMALKKVKKETVINQPHTAFFLLEKEIMVKSLKAEWLVSSIMTFQDDTFLYFLMEYFPGGDLLDLLTKDEVLDENTIKFYAAEALLALEELHDMGYIHRDVKPDNFLFDREGHIKLADFGSCIKLENGEATSSIPVGTPDYISPEVLGSEVYTETVDFWSLGVVMYEMYFGEPPFYTESLKETYSRIQNLDLRFPEKKITDELKDLISKMLTNKDNRIKLEEIKIHKFFEGIDWNNIKNNNPPIKIEAKKIEKESVEKEFVRKTKKLYFNFVGFTYDPQATETFVQLVRNSITDNKIEVKELIKVEEDKNKEGSSPEMNKISLIEEKKEYCFQCKEKINLILSEIEEIEKNEEENLKTVLDDDKINFNNKEEDKILLLEEENKNLKYTLEKEVNEKINIKNKKEELEIEIKTLKEKCNCSNIKILEEKISNEEKKNIKFIKEIENLKIQIYEKEKRIENKVTVTKKLNSVEMNSMVSTMKNIIKEIIKNLNIIKNDSKLLTEENKCLSKELLESRKSIEENKKILRIKKLEIKEIELKLEQEILIRKKLEDEIKYLKKEKKKVDNIKFSINILKEEMGIKGDTILIEGNVLKIGEFEENLNNCVIASIKNTDREFLGKVSSRDLVLIVKIVFIVDNSSSKEYTKSYYEINEELKQERNIKDGLLKMSKILSNENLIKCMKQIQGSECRIKELENELVKANRNNTLSDTNEKIYEFKNHIFSSKKISDICYVCSEFISNNAYKCKDCGVVTHNVCYVLMDTSCELYKGIKKGRVIYIKMRSLEEKEKLIKINK